MDTQNESPPKKEGQDAAAAKGTTEPSVTEYQQRTQKLEQQLLEMQSQLSASSKREKAQQEKINFLIDTQVEGEIQMFQQRLTQANVAPVALEKIMPTIKGLKSDDVIEFADGPSQTPRGAVQSLILDIVEMACNATLLVKKEEEAPTASPQNRIPAKGSAQPVQEYQNVLAAYCNQIRTSNPKMPEETVEAHALLRMASSHPNLMEG